MKITLEKRHKYVVHSLILLGLLYYFSGLTNSIGIFYIISVLLVALIGSFITQRPNSTIANTLVTGILPVSLTLGFVLSLIYFPNLSRIFKTLTLLVFSFIFYLVSLVNNVFLVVKTRKETIPLYRVASTWSKILIVIVAIPLLAGIFKINLNSLSETMLAGLSALLFYVYLIWSLKYDHEVKKYRKGELISLLALGVFFVLASNLAVSFFPTETFLRALYVSSIMIFGVSYIEGHLKNTINKRLISEHLVISTIFLILLFVFNP
jgi:hypothetical protein